MIFFPFLSPSVGPGFYPQVMHRLQLPEDLNDDDMPKHGALDPLYSMTHSAEVRAKVKILGRGGKSNLMSQVIPIYGFGILLYIIFIISKVIMVLCFFKHFSGFS